MMEMTTRTLLNAESKNIFAGLFEMTDAMIPDILKDLKTIQENEISFNIDELIKNKFSYSEDKLMPDAPQLNANIKTKIKNS